MDEMLFIDKLEDLYAGFCKRMPDEKIVEAIYKRIQDLPDDFTDFVIRRLEREEKLPSNIRFYLNERLRYEYQPNFGGENSHGCTRCNVPEMPGYIRLWDSAWKMARIFRCLCNCNPASGLMAITD